MGVITSDATYSYTEIAYQNPEYIVRFSDIKVDESVITIDGFEFKSQPISNESSANKKNSNIKGNASDKIDGLVNPFKQLFRLFPVSNPTELQRNAVRLSKEMQATIKNNEEAISIVPRLAKLLADEIEYQHNAIIAGDDEIHFFDQKKINTTLGSLRNILKYLPVLEEKNLIFSCDEQYGFLSFKYKERTKVLNVTFLDEKKIFATFTNMDNENPEHISANIHFGDKKTKINNLKKFFDWVDKSYA